MKNISIKPPLYTVTEPIKVLSTNYFGVMIGKGSYVLSLVIDNLNRGIVISGSVEVTIDSLVYNNDYGAIGFPTLFKGKKLVIVGVTLTELLDQFPLKETDPDENNRTIEESLLLIEKIQKIVSDKDNDLEVNIDNNDYILFGRRNFLLIGSKQHFILVDKHQICIRNGDDKLVSISRHGGVSIASRDRVLNFNHLPPQHIARMLGTLGIEIANSILSGILWES